MRPWRSSVSSTIADTSSSDATSARMPPSGGLRSATTTVAPSASSPDAIAAPIPCAPPVTIATLPSSALSAAARTRSGPGSGSAACGRAAAPSRGTPSSAGRPVGARGAPRGRRTSRTARGSVGGSVPISVVNVPRRPPRISCWMGFPPPRRAGAPRGASPRTRGSRVARRSLTTCNAADGPVLELKPLVDPVGTSPTDHPRLLHAPEQYDFGRDEPGVNDNDPVLEHGDANDAPDPAKRSIARGPNSMSFATRIASSSVENMRFRRPDRKSPRGSSQRLQERRR